MTAQPALTLSGTAPAIAVDLDHAEGQTHALTIEALIAEEHAARRAAFLAQTDHMPTDVFLTALQRLCARGFGGWTLPTKGPKHSSATHQHEVSLWGCPGFGPTEIEAARSWRIAARRLAEEEGAE